MRHVVIESAMSELDLSLAVLVGDTSGRRAASRKVLADSRGAAA